MKELARLLGQESVSFKTLKLWCIKLLRSYACICLDSGNQRSNAVKLHLRPAKQTALLYCSKGCQQSYMLRLMSVTGNSVGSHKQAVI